MLKMFLNCPKYLEIYKNSKNYIFKITKHYSKYQNTENIYSFSIQIFKLNQFLC